MPGMALALAIFGFAFAAFCVWLIVRIVNRRESWAKRTLVTVVGVPVLYVASFGPACCLVSSGLLPFDQIESVFCPIVQLMMDGSEPVRRAIFGYASICGGRDTALDLDSNWWWDNYGRSDNK